MISRKEYMAGACSHSEYYAQFAGPFREILKRDRSPQEWSELIDNDPHLNKVPLKYWDDLSRLFWKQTADKNRELNGVLGWSLSDGVCGAKEAARQIAKEGKSE